MATLSIRIGLLLVALGLIGYFATGMASLTALIPALFGALFLLLGWMAHRGGGGRKHAMHVASGVAMVGLLGALRGLPSFVRLLGGQQVERPAAAVSQAVMAVLCLVFLVFAMRSFARARSGRET